MPRDRVGAHREHLTFAFVFANGKALIAYTQCAQRYGELKMEQSAILSSQFLIFNFQLLKKQN